MQLTVVLRLELVAQMWLRLGQIMVNRRVPARCLHRAALQRVPIVFKEPSAPVACQLELLLGEGIESGLPPGSLKRFHPRLIVDQLDLLLLLLLQLIDELLLSQHLPLLIFDHGLVAQVLSLEEL